MPRGRTKGDHSAKRVQIAEAACKVFLRLGLGRTSLADIAREMGYTTGVLRHYFADRDELLLYAKNLLFDRSYARAEGAAATRVGLEKLRAMAVELLPTSPEAIDGYRLLAMFNGNAIGEPRLMKLQERRNDRHARLLGGIIGALQKEGILPKNLDSRFEAAGLLALIDGLAEQLVMRSRGWSRDALVSLLNRHIESLSRTPH